MGHDPLNKISFIPGVDKNTDGVARPSDPFPCHRDAGLMAQVYIHIPFTSWGIHHWGGTFNAFMNTPDDVGNTCGAHPDMSIHPKRRDVIIHMEKILHSVRETVYIDRRGQLPD